VFGIIKSVTGFRQFLLRGLDCVRGEWSLVTTAWNIKGMHALSLGRAFRHSLRSRAWCLENLPPAVISNHSDDFQQTYPLNPSGIAGT
jgi:hypothetical protein